MVNINRVGGVSDFHQGEERSDQYLTQPGDTMAGVAQSFGVSPQALAEANRFIANPNGPLPSGVYLTLPKEAQSKEAQSKEAKSKEANRAALQPPKEEERQQRERNRRRNDQEEEPEKRLSSANL